MTAVAALSGLQRQSMVCASLQANPVVFPLATVISICRSRFATCSGVCFFCRTIVRWELTLNLVQLFQVLHHLCGELSQLN